MSIEELLNCQIISVHWPNWIETFEYPRPVKNEDNHFSINGFYVIKKDRIDSVLKSDNRISIEMTDGQTVKLVLAN